MIQAFEIRPAGPDDAAALFVVYAAIAPADAGQLTAWTQELEARLETGARGWVAARGRQLAGYALVDPLPGLSGVFDLSGGVAPARRGRGIGGRLLRRVQEEAHGAGARTLSCRVESLTDETAAFLLRRGFHMEHEECLLELADFDRLPQPALAPPVALLILEREQAIREFLRLYDSAFDGLPWSQPYTVQEVAESLIQTEDLLFLALDGEPVGVAWHEILPDGNGRIEPIGIAHPHQGQGHGRALLLTAVHALRRRGAGRVEIGLWRQNEVAMNLYKGIGFSEVGNWYYLACDVD